MKRKGRQEIICGRKDETSTDPGGVFFENLRDVCDVRDISFSGKKVVQYLNF